MKRALLLSALVLVGCSPNEPRYELHGDGRVLLDKQTGCVRYMENIKKGYNLVPVQGLHDGSYGKTVKGC